MTGPSGRVSDPRSRADGLGWVSRAIFGDERIALTIGVGPPAGYAVAARYAVVPSVARARFLLPLGAPRAASAALLSYNALRPATVRAIRAVLGVAARSGAVDRAPFPVLTVALPAGLDPAEVLLADRLAALLGGGARYAACGVRPPDPNHKPTLALFDCAGRPHGYAKIGWNAATRALVTAEAAALRALSGIAGVGAHPRTPRLLAEAVWDGRAVAVVEPLPSGMRRLPAGGPTDPAALLAVARRHRPPAAPRPLAGSSFLTRLAAEARRAAATSPAGARVVRAVASLARRHGAVTVEFGHWHGDWVPWNLGRCAGEVVAWDWEHSGPDVPVGFDLAHDAFQRALVLRGAPVAVAVDRVAAALARHGARLGVDPPRQRLVLDAYLVQLWLRGWRLADAGAGWNRRLHPALLDVVEQDSAG